MLHRSTRIWILRHVGEGEIKQGFLAGILASASLGLDDSSPRRREADAASLLNGPTRLTQCRMLAQRKGDCSVKPGLSGLSDKERETRFVNFSTRHNFAPRTRSRRAENNGGESRASWSNPGRWLGRHVGLAV